MTAFSIIRKEIRWCYAARLIIRVACSSVMRLSRKMQQSETTLPGVAGEGGLAARSLVTIVVTPLILELVRGGAVRARMDTRVAQPPHKGPRWYPAQSFCFDFINGAIKPTKRPSRSYSPVSSSRFAGWRHGQQEAYGSDKLVQVEATEPRL